MYFYACTCLYVTCIYMSVCIYICMNIFMYVYMYVCVFMHVCKHVLVCNNVFINVCIFMHIHVCMLHVYIYVLCPVKTVTNASIEYSDFLKRFRQFGNKITNITVSFSFQIWSRPKSSTHILAEVRHSPRKIIKCSKNGLLSAKEENSKTVPPIPPTPKRNFHPPPLPPHTPHSENHIPPAPIFFGDFFGGFRGRVSMLGTHLKRWCDKKCDTSGKIRG